jgi:hypothetical protein
MLATPSATRQSPVGSAALAADNPDTSRKAEQESAIRKKFRGQCNIVKPVLALLV